MPQLSVALAFIVCHSWFSPGGRPALSVCHQVVCSHHRMHCALDHLKARRDPNNSSDVFSIVGQIAPEIRQWLKETFSLQQEVMTTALILSEIFPHPPRVVGTEWGPDWQVQVDDFPRLLPGDHIRGWACRSLVVLDEVGLNSLSLVWPKLQVKQLPGTKSWWSFCRNRN